MAITERFKVLIVAGGRSVTERIERLLGFIETADHVASINTAQDAVVTIRESKPDVVLVDTNLPDMNGIHLTELIRRDYPDVQVIVLSKDKIGDTVLNAMRRGASDFVTYEVPMEELRVSINRAGEIASSEKKRRAQRVIVTDYDDDDGEPKEKKGKIIAVYSPKGGVGVTAIAINLAIALQGSEITVGLVDSDMQYGDVGVLLNEVTSISSLDLTTRLAELDTRMVEDAMVLHRSSGIHLLAAPPRPELGEKVEGEPFAIVLDFLRQIFDYIVINTSVHLTEPCLAALESADIVIIVASQEIANIRNIRTFLSIWDNLGKGKDRLMLVLNRYDKKRSIPPEKISESFAMPIAITMNEDEIVYRSLNLGVPFMVSDKGSYPAHQIEELMKQVKALFE